MQKVTGREMIKMASDDNCWSNAVFRVSSESKSIEHISETLDIQPTRYIIKGESLSKRNPKSKKSEVNLWILESILSEQDMIESHIEYFISFLDKKKNSIDKLKDECVFDIACAYSSANGQGGFTLCHETLTNLSLYPINLSINLYPPECKSIY